METKLARISQLSKENPDMVFTSLGHLINKEMLKSCHAQMDGTKAVGIDGITKEEYGRRLEENISALIERLKKKSYKPKPARLVEIPKDNGKMRLLSIYCYEDKLLQEALRRILEAVFEPREYSWPDSMKYIHNYGYSYEKVYNSRKGYIVNELISLHKKLFGRSLAQGESLKTELELLQKLRNNETHFLIRQGSFLSEEDFCVLHNFMIRFYKIMETWCPIDKDDYELYILPYWGDPIGADSIYGFNREPLQSFSYETAVKNSKLAKKIAELLNGDYLYGAPDFSPYTITKDLIEQHMELSSQFDEIWSMVYMMQCLEMISVDEILDDEQGRVYFATSTLSSDPMRYEHKNKLIT